MNILHVANTMGEQNPREGGEDKIRPFMEYCGGVVPVQGGWRGEQSPRERVRLYLFWSSIEV